MYSHDKYIKAEKEYIAKVPSLIKTLMTDGYIAIDYPTLHVDIRFDVDKYIITSTVDGVDYIPLSRKVQLENVFMDAWYVYSPEAIAYNKGKDERIAEMTWKILNSPQTNIGDYKFFSSKNRIKAEFSYKGAFRGIESTLMKNGRYKAELPRDIAASLITECLFDLVD